ncbi:hypothetical protein [Usitatibacter palustris]|uniref:Lipoprotein n=1 Tax=Usitatibacter palustris TaxID=2732487 RepID=A0A6M4H746_9PROT|nr:hypothetical protein [Usitatibacter palustris]QJR15350.1 hypothetical protein DSM104440_02169 [Usitatibacter palustris]
MRTLTAFLLPLFLAACSGIPLMSMPKLIALQGNLLDANPAEFMVAIQADSRLTPPPGSSPVLHLDVKPKEEGSFPRIQKMLKMQENDWSPALMGLKPAGKGRKWFIYAFTPESAEELRKVQAQFRAIKAQNKGGSLQLGIAQENVAAKNPELGNTKWESWLQVSRKDGFFELWSGTLGELVAQGQPR